MLDVVPLESLVPLHVHGADARTFMQGQLTSDLKKLTPAKAVFGAHCTGQGRVQAMVTMLERPEGLIALFDAGPFDALFARLASSVLASKVVFERPRLVVAPVSSLEARWLVAHVPELPGECSHAGAVTVLRWWSTEERLLAILPHVEARVRPDADARHALDWRRAEVRAGVPHVAAATKGAFVPQTLNLDLMNAVSYDKGCYVGQEVVARARRGGVPRRMFRFSATCPPPSPGTVVLAEEAEVGMIVDAAASEAGCDVLAVVDLERLDKPLELAGPERASLALGTLPYAVPRERR